jgi:hypothetical protein
MNSHLIEQKRARYVKGNMAGGTVILSCVVTDPAWVIGKLLHVKTHKPMDEKR